MNIIIKTQLSRWFVGIMVLGLLLQPVQQVMAAEAVGSSTLATTGPSAPESFTAEPIGSEVTETNSPAEEVINSKNSEQSASEGARVDEGSADKQPGDEVTPEDKQQTEEEQTSPEDIPVPPVEPIVQQPTTVKQKVADADIASGALVYNYQLQVPNGRMGVQPDLSLAYNSQQNEEGSLVGFGWGLSLPTIERKNIDGLDKLYTSENFTSSLSGDLKKIGSSNKNDSGEAVDQFAAKIDAGSFLKYSLADQANGGIWTVADKSGTIYTFGSLPESRLSNPIDSTKVFRWYLTKVEDSKGNFVSYDYTKVNDQVYPAVIRYTRNGTDAGIFKIQFSLEDRPDKAMSAKYGFMITNTKRIAKVELLVQNILVGRYSLGYGQQSVNSRSQLTSIEYTGFDSAGQNGLSDGGMQFSYDSIAATDLLTKITQNTGGQTTVSYRSSGQYRDAAGGALNPHLPFAVQTVEKIQYDDRNGVTWQNSFQYAGGWFYYNGPMDRRFVGFEKVVRTDNAGNTLTSFYHQGNDSNSVYGEPNDDWAKAGKIYKSELRDSQGNLFTQTLAKWEFNRLTGTGGAQDRSFVKLSANVTRTFDGNSGHKDTASTYTYDTNTGNLISGVDWGEVNATDSGSFTDTGDDKVTTTVSFASPVGNANMVGISSGYIELNQTGGKNKQEKNYFDSLPFGQISLGNPTKTESWVSRSTYAATTRTFNSVGLPLTETDPGNHTTTYSYDSANLYPVTVTNALSQATSLEYDYRLGKPTKTTDPNGLVNKISFDGLGRATKEEFTKPGQSDPNNLFVKKSASYELYQLGGEVRGWKTVETNYLDEPGATSPRENKLVTYTDGFDRPIQIRALVESADGSPTESRYSVTDTAYNNLAQVAKQSLPYFGVGDSRTAISSDNNLFATLSYDPAYRVTATANAVGTSTQAYDDWTVTATDADGKVKVLTKDAFGRLEKVEEHNGSDVYTTKYSYDAAGNLVKIVDALGNLRKFEYDGQGHRLTAEDLHASDDRTFGIWSYQYDLAGNLSERIDANGVVVGYNYDALNRVATEDADKDKQFEATYSYDTCPKGVGRLCSVTNSALTANNEYNVLGQLTKETKTINGQGYVTEYSYDRQGNQLTIKNPDNSEVKYSYNVGGAVETVQSKESGATSFGNVVVDIDYAPTGAISYEQQANGAKVTNTYDAAKLYRLTAKVGTLPAAGGTVRTVQSYAYSYDPVGNILQIVDSSEINSRKTVDYTYDDLHRLTSARSSRASAGQNYIQHYEYDAIGNITYKSDSGTYSYDGGEDGSFANPHAVTKVATATSGEVLYGYDQNGNVIADGDQNYVWDYNNRITSITPDGIVASPVSYGYDASGTRVSVATATATTVYPSQFYNTSGAISGAGVQKHIFAGDSVVATIKGSGTGASLFALQSDHLGSTTVVSDASGALAETVDYFPFGSIRQNSTPAGNSEQRKFIGQEYDAATELSYLEARYYDPKLGRFLSEDAQFLAVGFDLSDPQSMNAYSYARNNPIRLKDSNGMWFTDFVKYAVSYTVGAAQGVVKAAVDLGQAAVAFAANPGAAVVSYAKQGYSIGRQAYSLATSTQARQEAVQNVKTSVNSFLDSSSAEQANKIGQFVGYAGLTYYLGAKVGVGESTLPNGLKVGEDFGSLGTAIENGSGKITGFNHNGQFHGIDQVINRGISPGVLQDTVTNPIARFSGRFGRTGYLSRDAFVSLDKTGQVVTSWSKAQFGNTINKVLNRIK